MMDWILPPPEVREFIWLQLQASFWVSIPIMVFAAIAGVWAWLDKRPNK